MGLRDESEGRAAPEATLAPGAVTALVARLASPPTSDAPPLLVPGLRLGRYEIIRAIGHGGFGTVHEAHDTALNRLVALKVMRRTEAADPAAAREGEAAARLAHSNIATLHDAGLLEDRTPYLVYELLHGETLETRLARGRMAPREALRTASGVARALAHAHEAGVVHRDLKPANVFLTADGEVKVLDFGVALLFGRATPAGGTPAYMAPEQRRGEPEDARTDLYALGLLLREMLTGDPAGGERAHAIRPLAAARVVEALLADDPAARPRSARAVLRMLEVAERATSRRRVRSLRIAAIAAAAALVAGGAALLVRDRARGPAPPPSVPSIAILPFADLSPQRDQEYFSDGVAEEILNALVQVEGVRVAGRSSSFAYKGRNVKVEDIGRALHVSAVLEGSVRKMGRRVRIATQLVATADGFHIWSQSYERDVTDVFAVQDDIAQAVAAALQVKLLPSGGPGRTREHLATRPEAYERYLLGRQLFHSSSPEGYRRAVEAYENALAIDPRYAPAWAGLAIAASYASTYASSGDEFERFVRRSRDAGPRAVDFDPRLAEAYAARGYVRAMLQLDWTGAREDMEHAIALSPRDAEIRRLYAGFVLGPQGLLDEAVESSRLATELDPGAPLCWNQLGLQLMFAGQLARGRAALEEALRLNPDQSFAEFNLVRTLVLEGDTRGALRVATSTSSPARRLAGLAIAHHALGNDRTSREALAALTSEYADRQPYAIALIHAFRGERVAALTWLERAAARSDREVFVGVKDDPAFRPLRADPRYAALLRRLNLPPD